MLLLKEIFNSYKGTATEHCQNPQLITSLYQFSDFTDNNLFVCKN